MTGGSRGLAAVRGGWRPTVTWRFADDVPSIEFAGPYGGSVFATYRYWTGPDAESET
jgi:hypothetical protein